MTGETAHIILPPPLVYLLPLLAGILLDLWWLPSKLFPEWWTGHVVGWPTMICGGLLQAWAMRTMVRAGTPMNIRKPTTAIVTTGPYAFSRNPMYISLTLLYVSITFIMNSIWPFVFLPAVLLFIHYRVILPEESYLERRFGDEYKRYRGKVRRWF